MKLALGFGIAVLLALGGCSANGKADEGADEIVPINKNVVEHVPLKPDDSTLALVGSGYRLRVGDPINIVDQAFARPQRAVSEFRDLPPGFGGGFRSRGWETDAEGVGTISYEGSIVTVVRTTKGLEEDQVQTILRKYLERITPVQPTIEGRTARYWFAEENGRRLMICAVRAKSGGYDVIEAIGEDGAMNALRMNSLAAKNDLIRADNAGKAAAGSGS